MFQSQVYFEGFSTSPTFVREKANSKSISLLRTTQQTMNGRNRLSTPNKRAILNLSTSFEKRRLGKQQRILSDIASRCREQEIQDLSTTLAGKMVLQEGSTEPDVSAYVTNYMSKKERSDDEKVSPRQELLNPVVQNSYKYFPARKIIKHQHRLSFARSSPRSEYPQTIPQSQPACRVRLLETRPINGPIQLEHYIQPKLDPLAPLLRDKSCFAKDVPEMTDNFFSTAQVNLGQRSKTMYETCSDLKPSGFRSHRANPANLEAVETKAFDVETASKSVGRLEPLKAVRLYLETD